MARRRTYDYTFRKDRLITHRGVTDNPERRARELWRMYPGGKMTVDGRAYFLPPTGRRDAERQERTRG